MSAILSSVAALLAMTTFSGANAQGNIDAAWFARCQPSDGAMHVFDSGASISFFNPMEGGGQRSSSKRGDLFILVTLKPGTRIRFEQAAAVAIGAKGEVLKRWEPVLRDIDEASASSAAVQLYADQATLVNDSSKGKSFRLLVASDLDTPDMFTLVLPPVYENDGTASQSMQLQYKRFDPAGLVRLCGINGITTRDRPYRGK